MSDGIRDGRYAGPTIIRAAIKTAGDLYHLPPPARHHNILHRFNLGSVAHVQGFLTSDGDFVTREEARKLAVQAGQIVEPTKSANATELFSEDLW